MLKIANHCHYHKAFAKDLVLALKQIDVTLALDLTIEDDSITLCSELHGQRGCYKHQFNDPKLLKRAGQKNQGVIRACQSRGKLLPTVLDVTAGWGRDSFILASRGCQVTMIEQNPLLFHCVNFLLELDYEDDSRATIERMQLLRENSVEYLQLCEDNRFDAIYLDPMFPAHKSTARPGKELQILQLLTENKQMDELFELARSKASKRVIVKRPIHAPSLREHSPDIVFREKTIRFDVYLCQS